MPDLIPRSRLLFESEQASPLGTISVAGTIRHSRGVSLTHLRTFGRFALVYLAEGSGRFRAAGEPVIPCRAGDLLFIHPEIPHGYGPGPREFWSEFYLVFSGSIFDLWRDRGLLDPHRPVRRLPQVQRWLPRLEGIVSGLPPTASGMLRRICRLQQFLADIALEPEINSAPVVPWLPQAMHELATKPGLRPAAIARSIGLSYETFRKEFQRHTGAPPAHYRLERRVAQACVLMTERALSNKELAETFGFHDEFHFSRRFRQIVGKSPRDFRRQQEQRRKSS